MDNKSAMKILIIEESKTAADYISSILDAQQFETVIAQTGKKALEILDSNSINIILLDLLVPDIDNIELLKRIRKTYNSTDLPVIVLGLILDKGKIAEVLEHGANDFISKPVTPITIQLKIKNFLQFQQTNMQLKASLEKQREQNRKLQALGESREVLMHADNEYEMCDKIADIIATTLQFTLVWIGLKVENASKDVEIITYRGFEKSYIENIKVNWDDSRNGNGPAGRSIKTGKSINITIEDPMFAPWKSLAQKHGFRSVLFTPLSTAHNVMGTIGFYSSRPEISQEDQEFLEGLAQKVAGGIQNLKNLKAQQEDQQALRENEERLRLAQKAANIGTWEWDLKTDEIIWEETMFKIFGLAKKSKIYSNEEFLSLVHSFDEFLAFVHPSDRDNIQKATDRALQKPENGYNNEYRIIKPDNTLIWISEQAEVFTDNQGKPVRMIGVMQDITKRKQNEQQIQMFSTVIEQSPSYVMITDLQDRVEYVNPAFTKTTGYTFDEVKGKTPRMLKSGKMKRETYADLWETLLKGQVWRGEFINRRKNGEEFYEKAVISPIINESGEIFKYFAIKEDITEEKEKEQKLLQSARIIKATYDSSNDSFILLDKAYNILAFNRTAAENLEKLWNKTPKEGDNMQMFVKKDDWELLKANADTAFSGKMPEQEKKVEYSGETRWFHSKFIPVYDENNTIFAVSFTSTDITESKRAIKYAQHIQRAVLPSHEYISSIITDHTIFFRPRDMVSGDFYWFVEAKGKTFITAADCTGHGVPGAFMSMLGMTFINEAVVDTGLIHPEEILEFMREKIIDVLNQKEEREKGRFRMDDGIDMALSVIEHNSMKMEFAGAKNPLYLVRNNGLQIIRPNRIPVGIHKTHEPFTRQEITLQKDDRIYVFTDGFPDQFGGKRGKKFKYKAFRKLILDIHKRPFKEQKDMLARTFDQWKGNYEQVDDVLVLGFKV